MKRGLLIVVFGAVVCPGVVMADLGDPLQNGDFSQPLTGGWTGFSSVAINAIGQAVMTDPPVNPSSFLGQDFTLPANAESLSFEFKSLFVPGSDLGFVASLLDPDTFDPLVPTDAEPGVPETFYFLKFSADGSVLADPNYVTLTNMPDDWTRVSLNLASLSGSPTDAALFFDLLGSGPSGSQILLDNVTVNAQSSAVVPAPGGMILCALGVGLIGLVKRVCGRS